MTHLLKPEDKRTYGIDGNKPGCTALLMSVVALGMIGAGMIGTVMIIVWILKTMLGI